MTDDPAQLAERLEQIAAMVRRLPAASDWIDAYLSGEMLLTDQAVEIAATSTETIRRRCEATASTSRPLGVLIAGSVWLLSRPPVPCRNFVSLAKRRLRRCVRYLTDILGISLSLDPLPRRNNSLIRGTNVPALGTEHGGHHHD
jgi:hypothetical protein